ncbi:phosphotransferase [Sulfurospirillum diekertiae]|uniref:Methylthioribose kinase n=1 Tax=Sulfurospirillum diekertiae TaxID=1854492 RepID=A0A1Y0HIT1_9BACT|nr:phosphotransferase [Sulfurospirillum diekertiae]ARU48009.1 Methylthioribose kinase [Sulfurospirillum diekertiae]ASC92856.1 Methylthioribose kinase [Sulfurospirillum diekertiae]
MQTENEIIDYIKKTTALNTFFNPTPLHVSEIGDGNLNFIFRVSDERKKTLILKYAAPYLRLLGKDFPLPQERICVEMHTLSYFKTIAPSFIPNIYHCDEEAFCFAMEDLVEYKLLQSAQFEQFIPLSIYTKLGLFLATLYAKTPPKKDERYYENATLKRISEEYIFIFPYISNHPALVLPSFFCSKSKSALFLQNINLLLNLFQQEKECLIHGDLHTGSIMIKNENIAIIDAEFSFFGPLGFDVGTLLAHILLGEIYTLFEKKPLQFKPTISAFWKAFEKKVGGVPEHILQQSVGFCGAELSRRLVVPAKAKPLEAIRSKKAKTKAYVLCENLSIELVEHFLHVKSVEAFIAIVERHLCVKTH